MHLKVYSTFTLLGSILSIAALVNPAKRDRMDSLALTDRNVLYGAVALTQACEAAGIRPIIGLTLSVQSPAAIGAAWAQGSAEIVLLARSAAGYRNMCRLLPLYKPMQAARGRSSRAVSRNPNPHVGNPSAYTVNGDKIGLAMLPLSFSSSGHCYLKRVQKCATRDKYLLHPPSPQAVLHGVHRRYAAVAQRRRLFRGRLPFSDFFYVFIYHLGFQRRLPHIIRLWRL